MGRFLAQKMGYYMWHVETDYFSLAVFIIMLFKNREQRKDNYNFQGKVFYIVLIFSIISNIVDIVSSTAMNVCQNWWFYQISMTLYVVTMPMLAAVWVCYAYVIIQNGKPIKKLRRDMAVILLPYMIYSLLALTNPVTGLFFELGPNMEYSRGPLFMSVGVGSIMFYSAAGLALVLFNIKKITPRVNAVLIMAFFVTTGVFIWVQLGNPGWLVIHASYALIYIWCDITVEEQRRKELYSEISRKNEELESIAKRLRVTAEEAERANNSKTEFLRCMSHDLRTPINGIRGMVEIAGHCEDDVEKQRECRRKIWNSSEYLLNLVNTILDMNRLELGKITPSEDPFELTDVFDDFNNVIGLQAQDKGITLVNKERSIEHSHLTGGALHLREILMNLGNNAVKYTNKGGTIETSCIEKSSTEDTATYLFVIKDNGIGMTDEFQKRAFEAFTQESSVTSGGYTGIGLGLSITKKLVDQLGGTIRLESEKGKGTAFYVEIPFKINKVNSDAVENADDAQESTDLSGMNILLVEDNDLNREIARYILEESGASVYEAFNGEEAVRMFKGSELYQFDVILMDIMMPLMNGYEATRAIRSLDRPDAGSVIIIAMSANAFQEDIEESIKSGMNRHLAKPLNSNELISVINRYKVTDDIA